MSLIKTIMDNNLSHVKIDRKLANEIHRYKVNFINKNDNHIAFFGGNLTGVHPIKHTTKDRNIWLIDILDVDERLISNEVKALPDIGEDWKRGTDAFNLTCFYLVHRFYNSNLPKNQKHEAMKDILMIVQFKLLSSILSHNYPNPVSEGLAKATYMEMSGKFTIKKEGTWLAVIEHRSEDILRSNGIHLKTIKDFDTNKGIQNMITDIQGRFKSMIKYINLIFYDLRDSKRSILTSGRKIELDGKVVLRDIEREQDKYKRYLAKVITNKDDFVKRELIEIVCDIMSNISEKQVYDVLVYMNEQAMNSDSTIEKVVDELIIHAFESIKDDRGMYNNLTNVAPLLKSLRSLYTAARSKDPSVLYLRDTVENVVEKALKIKTKSTIAGIRTTVLLYMILRTFTMRHYTSS